MSDTDNEDPNERWLDVARDSVARYFGNVAGKSKRLRRGGYRFSVRAGERDECCSVSVTGGEGLVSLLFSPKPAWALSTFQKLVHDRMASDIDLIPELTYGTSQGRLAVHVPTTGPGIEFQTAVFCVCSIYDASGPVPGQAASRNPHLECAKHLPEGRMCT
jgi:hypothetical protein